MLKAIHEGHLGIEKCKARARICVHWPSLDDDIERVVRQCLVCNQYTRGNQKEQLHHHSIPMLPWHKVGADYFTVANQDYLLAVDYFSKYPEVIPVKSKLAYSTIKEMKAIFARHGIPNTVIADNMPFHSKKFYQFPKEWNFTLIASSPRYPQYNVQTVKNFLKKAKDDGNDEYLAMLEFRNSPITSLYESPAQLLMGRRLQSALPMFPSLLEQTCNSNVKQKLNDRQMKQKFYYDRIAKQLLPLKSNDVVRFKHNNSWKQAVVVGSHFTPRSYTIRTTNGTILRRNRRYLKKMYEQIPPNISQWHDDDDESSTVTQQTVVNMSDNSAMALPVVPVVPPLIEKRSRYGRLIRLPVRYGEDM